MPDPSDDLRKILDVAASLRPARPARKPLPRLLFVTDPTRTPEPERIAMRLPAGAGVVFRAFGAADAGERGARLAAISRERGLHLLIGADAGLAEALGADGVHLPERDIGRAPHLAARRPDWILTAAAHSPQAAVRAAESGCDAVLASTVFASGSASAGQPMGAAGFAAFVEAAPLPVYALGGINVKTAPALSGGGAAGLAMVEGWRFLEPVIRT